MDGCLDEFLLLSPGWMHVYVNSCSSSQDGCIYGWMFRDLYFLLLIPEWMEA
jgi:hypothetical protein